MSTYTGLSKAELLQVLEQRDSEVIELLTKLEKESVKGKLDLVNKEAQLLGKDLLKVAAYIYELGFKANQLLKDLLPIKSASAPRVSPQVQQQTG
jgi:hypothetical protein